MHRLSIHGLHHVMQSSNSTLICNIHRKTIVALDMLDYQFNIKSIAAIKSFSERGSGWILRSNLY